MNTSSLIKKTVVVSALALSLVMGGSAFADDHVYQVTGPIVSMTPTSIVVLNKDKENWTVSRDGSTKITGELKVGAKVTIKYHMVADTVTAK